MFKGLIELKETLYEVKDNQRSHTFTIENGISITIGHRTVENFDDTVHIGIEKIKNWVYGLADGSKKKEMEAVINTLLQKNKDGNLKASRVIELKKIAKDINDKDFQDGVQIIEDAYKPTVSSKFIEVYYKDELNKKKNLPLSITSANI